MGIKYQPTLAPRPMFDQRPIIAQAESMSMKSIDLVLGSLPIYSSAHSYKYQKMPPSDYWKAGVNDRFFRILLECSFPRDAWLNAHVKPKKPYFPHCILGFESNHVLRIRGHLYVEKIQSNFFYPQHVFRSFSFCPLSQALGFLIRKNISMIFFVHELEYVGS